MAQIAMRAADATSFNCLRNALAHGAITYLDGFGLKREDKTSMLASAAYPAGDRRTSCDCYGSPAQLSALSGGLGRMDY